MKQLLSITIISSGLVFSAAANAVPNTFSSGQPARAAEVNANFADVETQIGNNTTTIQGNAADIQTNAGNIQANTNAINAISQPPVYDYRNFTVGSNVVSKSFTNTGLGCGDTETRSFSFSTNAADANSTDVVVTRSRFNSGVRCNLSDTTYLHASTARTLVSGNNYNNVDDSLNSTKVPVLPIVTGTSTMREGAVRTNGTVMNSTLAFDGSVISSVLVETRSVTGIENVSVPAGNYTGCLKQSIIRKSDTFGEFHRVSWHCPGVGEVKRIQINTYPDTATGEARRRHQTWDMDGVVFAAP